MEKIREKMTEEMMENSRAGNPPPDLSQKNK
jgi:hypothetical protein